MKLKAWRLELLDRGSWTTIRKCFKSFDEAEAYRINKFGENYAVNERRIVFK